MAAVSRPSRSNDPVPRFAEVVQRNPDLAFERWTVAPARLTWRPALAPRGASLALGRSACRGLLGVRDLEDDAAAGTEEPCRPDAVADFARTDSGYVRTRSVEVQIRLPVGELMQYAVDVQRGVPVLGGKNQLPLHNMVRELALGRGKPDIRTRASAAREQYRSDSTRERRSHRSSSHGGILARLILLGNASAACWPAECPDG